MSSYAMLLQYRLPAEQIQLQSTRLAPCLARRPVQPNLGLHFFFLHFFSLAAGGKTTLRVPMDRETFLHPGHDSPNKMTPAKMMGRRRQQEVNQVSAVAALLDRILVPSEGKHKVGR